MLVCVCLWLTDKATGDLTQTCHLAHKHSHTATVLSQKSGMSGYAAVGQQSLWTLNEGLYMTSGLQPDTPQDNVRAYHSLQ